MRLQLFKTFLTILLIFALTYSETILITTNQSNQTSKLQDGLQKKLDQISLTDSVSTKLEDSEEKMVDQNKLEGQKSETSKIQLNEIHKSVPVLLPLKRRENQFIDTKDNLSYKFDIQNKDGNIQIHILDSQLKRHELKIDNQNELRLVDTYRNLIIIKQIEPSQDQSALDQLQLNIYQYKVTTTLRYYHVYKIQPLTANDTLHYQIKYITRVNATFDKDEFDMREYSMLGITEFEQKNQLLYVLYVRMNQQYGMYHIDLKQNQTRLSVISRIASQSNFFIGGNSKVLVDGNSNQIFIDKNNMKNSSNNKTTFQKLKLSEISTELQFYPGNTHVVDFSDWNFYVYSHSDDNLRFSGFLYWGYSGRGIAQVSLTSDQPIKYFFDSYHFFIAVCSNNVLWYHLEWNQYMNVHVGWTITAKLNAYNEFHLQTMVKNFKHAEQMIYIGKQLFVITSQSALVYNKDDMDFDVDKQIKLKNLNDWKQNDSYSNNQKFILQYLEDKKAKTGDNKQTIISDQKHPQSNQNKTIKQGNPIKQASKDKHNHKNQRRYDDRRFFR